MDAEMENAIMKEFARKVAGEMLMQALTDATTRTRKKVCMEARTWLCRDGIQWFELLNLNVSKSHLQAIFRRSKPCSKCRYAGKCWRSVVDGDLPKDQAPLDTEYQRRREEPEQGYPVGIPMTLFRQLALFDCY